MMRGRIQKKRSPSRKGAKHGRRSSKIPEKTVEQIFDERYPLDKWEDSNYSILDKFSMRGRKGFVTGAAGGLGRNAAAALAQAGADVALVDLPSQEDKLTELAKDMSERSAPTSSRSPATSPTSNK